MKKAYFETGEIYHIYNRGIDKRVIFEESGDLNRFLQSMEEFNTLKPVGSIYKNNLKKKKSKSSSGNKDSKHELPRLVDFVCFCLNPNHFHFMLEQLVDDGISKFMHRIKTGYTLNFNKKHKRVSSLFERGFNSILIDSDEYLMHLSAYVNLNNRVHNKFIGSGYENLTMSSWDEYIKSDGKDKKEDFCKKSHVFNFFEDGAEYKKYAESTLKEIKDNKEIDKFLLE